uniref:sigma-54-dependent transcriptional regulator n=1 Tax=Methylogaea oryzae TaxID=1295382 RepID=UPI001C3F1692
MLPTAKPTVLLVEDSGSLAAVYQGYLREEAVQLVLKASGAEAMAFLALHAPSVVLLDLKLPDMDGMDILKHIHEHGMPCSVVIITAHGSVDVAVDAMRYGAFDFIEKPFNAKRLLVTVRNALERQNLSRLVETYRENFGRDSYHGFLGASLAMQAVYRMIDSAAASKATVFITGESGTGKEVCADAIHKQSPRKDKPFVALNCAAIPRDLMESEIFGHVKGAFTGAAAERKGRPAWRTAARCFWTKFARWIWICKANCCVSSRPARSRKWAPARRNKPISVSSAPPIAILGRGAGRSFPRGLVLPLARHSHRLAAAAGAGTGRSADRAPFFARIRQGGGQGVQSLRAGMRKRAVGLCLAGQCAAAAQRDPQRGGAAPGGGGDAGHAAAAFEPGG